MELPKGVHLLEVSKEKGLELWDKLNGIQGLWDDFTVNRPEVFLQKLGSPDSVWLERDDENGILYLRNVIPGLSASGHLVYWDRKLRGREEFTMEVLRWLMTNIPLQKINIYLPDYVQAARAFIKRLGFKEEGCIRRWSYSGGKTFDIYVFGMTREEAFSKVEDDNGSIHGTVSDDIQPERPGVREPVPGLAESITGDVSTGDSDISGSGETSTG